MKYYFISYTKRMRSLLIFKEVVTSEHPFSFIRQIRKEQEIFSEDPDLRVSVSILSWQVISEEEKILFFGLEKPAEAEDPCFGSEQNTSPRKYKCIKHWKVSKGFSIKKGQVLSLIGTNAASHILKYGELEVEVDHSFGKYFEEVPT